MADQQYAIRVAMENGRRVVQELRTIGNEGDAAFEKIESGAGAANNALENIDKTAGNLDGGFSSSLSSVAKFNAEIERGARYFSDLSNSLSGGIFGSAANSQFGGIANAAASLFDFGSAGESVEETSAFIDQAGSSAEGLASSVNLADRASIQYNRTSALTRRQMLLIGGAVGGAVIGFGVLSDQISDTAENLRALGDSTDATGLETNLFSALRLGAAEMNVEVQSLESGLTNFNTILNETRKYEGALFERLRNTNQALAFRVAASGNSSDALRVFADALTNTASATERAELAQIAFGSAGADVLRVVDQGGAGLASLEKHFDDLGLAINENGITAANEFSARWGELMERLGRSRDQVFTPLVIGINNVWDALDRPDDAEERLEAQIKRLQRIANGSNFSNTGIGNFTGREEARLKLAEAEQKLQEIQIRRAQRQIASSVARLENTARINREQKSIEETGKNLATIEKERAAAAKIAADEAERAAAARAREAEAAQRALEREVNSLTLSVRTEDEVYRDEIARYRELLDAAVISQDTFDLAVQRATDNLSVNQEALARQNEYMARGADITRSVRTESEIFADNIAELNVLFEAGAISFETYNRRAAELQAGLAASSEEAAQRALQESTRGIDGFRRAYDQYRDYALDTASQIESATLSAFRGMEDALVGFVETGKLDFSSLARSIIADIVRIEARRNITNIFGGGGFDGVFGGRGLGGLFGAGVSAGVAHSGGMAGEISTTRTVSPALFAGAPRYHSGGIAGLRPGEVPIIAQRGERILNREETRDYNRGGGQMININFSGPPPSTRKGRLQFQRDIASAMQAGRRAH